MKKNFFFLLFTFACITSFFGAVSDEKNWVIASTSFTVEAEKNVIATVKPFEKIFPQLLLENLSSSLIRKISEDELFSRTNYDFLIERQKYLNEYTRAIAKRDALFFSTKDTKELQELLQKENENILSIREKMGRNIASEQTAIQVLKEELAKKKYPVLEKVSLWNNSSSSLYSYKDLTGNQYKDSLEVRKDLKAKKIDGLIIGSIKIIGDFIQITAELIEFPSKKVLCSVFDIGSLEDIELLAENISIQLLPYISNSEFAEIVVKIEPADAMQNAQVILNDQVFKMQEGDSGIHFFVQEGIQSFRIEASGFYPLDIEYAFVGAPSYEIFAPMKKIETKIVYFELPLAVLGSFSLNGLPYGDNSCSILINNQKYLGQVFNAANLTNYFFLSKDFFYSNDNLVMLDVPKQDISELIMKNRRKMYFSYGLTILSMPLVFYSLGTYNSLVSAWNVGIPVDYNKITMWKTTYSISIGVLVGMVGYMGFRIYKYIDSTNKILPKEPVTAIATPQQVNSFQSAENSASLENKEQSSN